VPVLLAATALDEVAHLRDRLADWRFPTLVVHGSADTYTDPAASREFVEDIAAEDNADTAPERLP
jgi:alpha-beta hydrolase superfamily lysophospholipase